METRVAPTNSKPKFPTHKFFHASPEQQPAARLFQLALHADYRSITTMLGGNPSLMFEPVTTIFPDGGEETISTLQYAFKTYDTYLWKICLKLIEQDEMALMQFYQQESEQTQHIDLEPLFTMYELYGDHYDNWDGRKQNMEQICDTWNQVGLLQYKLLPIHMLKELCRVGQSAWYQSDDNHWFPTASFDTNTWPAPKAGKIFHVQSSKYFELLQFSRRGTLCRMFSSLDCLSTSEPVQYRYVKLDLETFQQLVMVRKSELDALKQNRLESRVQFKYQ